jgi:2,3-bisphosphoglycerate-independent phosphoglycerate mutase
VHEECAVALDLLQDEARAAENAGADEVATLAAHWEAYDFVFLHYNDTDKAGEDGENLQPEEQIRFHGRILRADAAQFR